MNKIDKFREQLKIKDPQDIVWGPIGPRRYWQHRDALFKGRRNYTRYYSKEEVEGNITDYFSSIEDYNEYTKEDDGKRVYKGEFESAGGYVCWCPRCEKYRATDRCACMCGSCYACGYRWVCNPNPVTESFKL